MSNRYTSYDEYGLRHLPRHLARSGRVGTLREMLFEFDWLQAKLDATDVNALIADYDLLPDDVEFRLVQGALRLSAHALVQDKTQLRSQLWGRLLTFERANIQALMASVKAWQGASWLRPLSTSLTLPGGPLLRTFEGHSYWVTAVAVAQNGKRVISASGDRTLKVWDVETGQVLRTFDGHSEWINAVAVTADGQLAISGSQDGVLKVWNTETGQVLHTIKGHSEPVRAVAVTGDGKIAISGSDDTMLKVWDLPSGQVLNSFVGHEFGVSAVAVPMRGRFLISGGIDRKVKRWDLETGQLLRTLNWDSVYELDTFVNHFGNVDALAVTEDGRYVLSAYGGHNKRSALVVWDTDTGEALRAFGNHTGRVWAVAMTADGRLAISGSKDKTLKVWNIETGEVLRTFESHTGGIVAVAVTPDGRYAISGSEDHTLKIWDIETEPALQHKPEGHSSPVKTLSLSWDGKSVISASDDGVLKTWDTETGRELNTYRCSLNALYVYNGPVRAWLPMADLILLWATDNRTADGQPAEASRGMENGLLQLCNPKAGRSMYLQGLSGYVRALTVVRKEDKLYVIAVSNKGTVNIWNLIDGQLLRTLEGDLQWKGAMLFAEAVALSADGWTAIAYADYDYTVKMWNIDTDQPTRTLEGHWNRGRAAALTADGRFAIMGFQDGVIAVWDTETGRGLSSFQAHSAPITTVALTWTGLALSASEDNTVKVWGVPSGSALVSFTAESDLYAAAFSPSVQTIVTGDASGWVHFLRLEGLKLSLESTNKNPTIFTLL